MSSDKEERKSLLGSSGSAPGRIPDPVFGNDKKSPPGSVSSASSYGSMASKTKFQPPPKKKQKSGGGMFRFATKFDYFLIFCGSLASFLHGAGWPLLSIVLGGMTDTFLRAQSSDFVTGANSTASGDSGSNGNRSVTTAGLPQISREEFEENVVLYCIYYAVIGVLMFFSSYVQIACWEIASERQVHRLRQSYFKSILRQEIAWFDNHQSGQLTTRLNDDLERVREGIGDKFSLFIQFVSAFLAGFIIGFVYNWQMTLVMMSLTPLIAATGAWMAKVTAGRTHVEQQKYAVAGGIAEETLSCIRTVLSLNGQKREINRYDVALEDGRRTGLWKYFYMGVGFAVTFMCMFGSYALAFWFGSRLVVSDPSFDRGTIFTVFFAVMSGSSALGGALPHFGSIAIAKGACKTILQVIDNEPTIDPYSVDGQKPTKIVGKIKLNNIKFSYPVRKDITVLKNVSLTVEPGMKIALVGSSGCGKSTIVNLLLRYYDPDEGTVTIDGHDVRSLNVEFLRKTIGVVSQEPVLFDGTLESNIRLGNDDVTTEQIIAATKQANAYKFINMLPDGLQTRVGERGVQLSGGQKQRIAIARAIVRNPKILLLDEATSALDTESEGLVQAALDQAQKGRTTLIVAHRLSTIRDATRIFVFTNGEIIEQGTHDELMAARGAFYRMVLAQQLDDGSAQHKATTEDEVEETVDVLSTTSGTARRKATETSRYSRQASSNRKISSYTESVMSSRSSAAQIKELGDAVDEHNIKPSSMTKIFMINRKAWKFLFVGLIGCSLTGLVMPAFALFYSEIFSVFSEPVDRLESDALFWSMMFLVLGVVQGGGFFISANMLGRSGENITKTMRLSAFSNLLRQDVAYFDDEKHGTGKICTRFATDAPNVRYVFTRLPMVVSSVITVLAAIVIAFVFGWKLAFLLVAMVPFVIASGYFEMKMQFGKQMRDTEELEEAGKTASEAIENVRTVQALTREFTFLERYCDMLIGPFKQNLRQAHVYGFVFGFSQSIIFFMYAAAFRFGAFLVVQGDMMPLDVYRVFFAIAFCGQSVGQISSFIPDVVKARLAAALLFHMIEYEPLIDSMSPAGLRPDLKGAVQLKNVHFAYPTRPGVQVLQGLNLSVQPGQTLALVGPSGCGKSTVVGLLERFYDAQKGQIFIDGLNIKTLNLNAVRNQMGLVSQEPLLFDCTIRENIIYGLEGRITHDQVIQAAKLANIHQFILTLPMGYDTKVGEKGTQLSGGQKQRIAIARALIRNPKILLLDEATSALDTESEKVVQEALDNARQGRTSIVIAHRLSTIQSADSIAVINEGKVVEKGTHAELLEKKGLYFSLCQMQNLMDSQ